VVVVFIDHGYGDWFILEDLSGFNAAEAGTDYDDVRLDLILYILILHRLYQQCQWKWWYKDGH